jgi:hypothetical protein
MLVQHSPNKHLASAFFKCHDANIEAKKNTMRISKGLGTGVNTKPGSLGARRSEGVHHAS